MESTVGTCALYPPRPPPRYPGRMSDAWKALQGRVEELKTIEGLMALAEWDQQVMMPQGGAQARGGQLALLSGLYHEKLAGADVGGWLDRVEPEDEVQAAAVRNMDREYRRASKLPKELVTEQARARSDAFGAWVKAKAEDDFDSFAPHLATVFDLTRQSIEYLREPHHRCAYDVMLEAFDPGSTVEQLDPMFDRLAEGTAELLKALEGCPAPKGRSAGSEVSAQASLNQAVAAALGFDLQGGRLDNSEHPFTIGMVPTDVRITTHLYPDRVLQGLSATIHETGHGLYEQGLTLAPKPVAKAAGMGLHESQSRFWENFIGRSRPFCRWLEGLSGEHLSQPLDAETLYTQANQVKRSVIRIFADEVTYNLHIIVRYRLERRLVEGEVEAIDLPEAWDAEMEKVLGIRPERPSEGVLQDVHWSSGAIGYFPSYTLGNLYAASLGAVAEQDIPQLWQHVESGEFAPILSWLREKVHRHGHLYDAPELMRRAVGERDHVQDLLDYLWGRHGALYGATR